MGESRRRPAPVPCDAASEWCMRSARLLSAGHARRRGFVMMYHLRLQELGIDSQAVDAHHLTGLNTTAHGERSMCCGTARRSSSRCFSACFWPSASPRTWAASTTSSTSIRKRSGSGCKSCRTCSATPSPPSATASSTPATDRRRPPEDVPGDGGGGRRRRDGDARGLSDAANNVSRGGAATAAATRKTAGRIGDGITQARENRSGRTDARPQEGRRAHRRRDFIGGVIGVIGGGAHPLAPAVEEWSTPFDELSGGRRRGGAGSGSGTGRSTPGSGALDRSSAKTTTAPPRAPRRRLRPRDSSGVQIALRCRLLRRQAPKDDA